jgi:tetratricopeptide (TPR) repeat protein
MLLAACWTASMVALADGAAQPPSKPSASTDKELEPVAQRIREGRLDEALGLIKEKAAQHPEWPPAHLILARLLFGANQPAAGRRVLVQAALAAPLHPDVYLTFGGLALGDGRLSDARLNFEKSLELAGSGRRHVDKSRTVRRESYSGLAAICEAREDWKTAHERLNSLLDLEPKNGQARQRLGRVLFKLDRAEDAFAALTQAVKDEPSLEPAAVSMGWLYTQAGDPKKAEEWFDFALKVDPASARVRLARAAWLLEEGQAPAARPEIDEALKRDPASKEARKLRGLIAWHLHDLGGTEGIFESLHRDAPADPVAANLLALALIEQDEAAKRSRGLQLAEVNMLQFPTSRDATATLGWGLYRAGRLDQAEQKLRAAVAGVKTTPDIAYYLARVLADKGRTDDARKLLESATEHTGSFAHRADAAALLKSLPR